MIITGRAAALLGLITGLVAADGLYSKNSPVLQLDARSYHSLVAQSNHTSIVEFYAPWCGHCQNLKPAYEKAAKNLAGLAKVAAVNCDEEDNKPFCGSFGVNGFPTLKIVRPSKKPGKPIVEDYQGPREAKAIVDAVVDKIPNHVKRLKEADVEEWLADTTTPAKAILFTEKGTTSALIRSLAVDFLGSIGVGQVRSTEKAVVEKFGIEKFPSVLLFPGDGQDPIAYSGEVKRQALVDFLSQVAPPNPDPAPKKTKPSSAKKSSAQKAPKAHKASKSEDTKGSSTVVLDEDTPTESPVPIVEQEKPIASPEPEVVAPIATLATASELEDKCIAKKSSTCILVLLPVGTDSEDLPEPAVQALNSLAEIAHKQSKRKDHTFPFYGVPAQNERAQSIRAELELGNDSEVEIIALNNKRSWWIRYAKEGYDLAAIETFVDDIKLGEGSRQKLPKGFDHREDATETEAASSAPSISEAEATSEEEAATTSESSASSASPTSESEISDKKDDASSEVAPEPEASANEKHDEL